MGQRGRRRGQQPRRVLVAIAAFLGGCHLLFPYTGQHPPGDGARERAIDFLASEVQPLDLSSGEAPVDPKVEKDCEDGWCVITAGPFWMGSPDDEPCRQAISTQKAPETKHHVTLTHSFQIMQAEVTRDSFLKVMAETPSTSDCSALDDNLACPVDSVTWQLAAGYCNKLSESAGKTACYDCTTLDGECLPVFRGQDVYACEGYRLPTEAEWERAYRAGTMTAYHSGQNDPSACTACNPPDEEAGAIAWYACNSAGKSHSSGSSPKAENGFGLRDMAGNLWEWCHDEWQEDLGLDMATDPVKDPATATSQRVLRGGSYNSYPADLRAARRIPRSASSAALSIMKYVGFRCARSLLSR